MFERYSDAARNIVSSAQEEARLMRHERLGTEHLLVALAHEPEIAALGLDPERARAEVVKTIGLGEHDEPGFIPLTAAAQEALDDALGEAMRLGQHEIGTGHVLLGVLKQRDGVARRILVAAGATPSEFREAVSRRLQGAVPDEDVMALLAIVERGGPVADWLRERGVHADAVRRLL